MNKYIFLYFLEIILFLSIIKLYESCPKDTPFLKEGNCISSCMEEEINAESCLIDNEIVKTQWISNIDYISGNKFVYFNMALSQKGDLLILVSSYPATNTRILYGITKEGRGYFNDNKIYTMELIYDDDEVMGKFESEIFMIKLASSTATTEYIFSLAKTPQLIEVYDLNAKKYIIAQLQTIFIIYMMSIK